MFQGQYPELIELQDYPFPVYVSQGAERRGHDLASRCAKARRYLGTTLGFEAELCLLVLAPEHWQDYTGSPMFGVPQTIDTLTLVVAGQNSALWEMIIPPVESISPSAAHSMRAVYGQRDGSMDIAAYMDLLPVHEVGHLFLDQAAGQFDFHLPRRWLVELFCNLSLHAYVATEEQEQLPYLETFPQTIVAGGGAHHQHRSLIEFETLYAGMEPSNFVWYLSRLHAFAKRIYEVAGTESLRRLHKMIVQSRDNLSDKQLLAILRADVHPEVAEVLAFWESRS